MANWPLFLYSDPTWETDAHPLAQPAIANLLDRGKLTLTDGWNILCDVSATRLIHYPFYPTAISIEMQITLPFNEGCALGSWLVIDTPSKPHGLEKDDQNLVATQENDDETDKYSIFFLNGTSPPIHEINAKLPLHLPDEKIAEAYLKFFCAHVWGKEGGFWICDSREDIPFTPGADLQAFETTLHDIMEPVYNGKNEQGHFLFDATVQYSNAIFKVSFAVQPTGMVEMLDDEPIGTDLPVLADQRVQGFRIL